LFNKRISSLGVLFLEILKRIPASTYKEMLLGDIIFELSDNIATNSFNSEIFNQVNVKELIRDVEEEEVIRLLKQIVENNQKILEL